uniref:DUF2013 domain-containing protein n=1 Tax=Steinernema glaseri TaxID=37863 RepID=A0A1I7Y2K4_9BILA
MYRPQFNAAEQAALILDILRAATDCDMEVCKTAAHLVIEQLLRTISTIEHLYEVNECINREDIVDVEHCADSVEFDAQTTLLNATVRDRSGPGKSSYESNDDLQLCTQMDSVVDVLKKADTRMVNYKFATKFNFIDDIIQIYRLSQNALLRANVLKSLMDLCKLSGRIKPYLISSNFISDVVLNTDLKNSADVHTKRATEFFGIVFDCEEEPSELLYEYMNSEFIAELMSSANCSDIIQFLIHFTRPRTVEILHEAWMSAGQAPGDLGNSILEYINQLSTTDDDRGLQFLLIVYRSPLRDILFYNNDVKVIYDVLERVICGTSHHPMRLLALRVAALMMEAKVHSDHPQIVRAAKVLLMRDDLSTEETNIANTICDYP